MKKRIPIVLFIVSIFMFWGCYPQGPDYAEEMDVVLTKHNEEYDFTAKGTYAMPDSIVKITGDALLEGKDPDFIPRAYAQVILGMIEENMEALGWDRVTVSANPDLILLPASWESTTVYYWYDYWYWWYGGYYPGWGWGGYYPGYYPPVYYTSYTTGSLLMTLIDKGVIGANGNPVTQWSGLCSGLMTGAYDATRLERAIDKAFNISPYLQTN